MANRPYKSFIDFINKVDISKVNKRVQKHLIEAGAFDSFGVNRNKLLAGYLDITPKEKGKDKQLTLFGAEAGFTFDYPDRHEPTLSEKIKMEKESMGIPASGDFIDLYPELADAGIPKDLNSGRVRIFGILKSIRKIFTKKDNREMCFMTVGNNGGQIDIVVFPNQFSIFSNILNEDAGLIIDGNLQNGSLIADSIELLRGGR
jgi:DNA polymerase-3 subunit alpha